MANRPRLKPRQESFARALAEGSTQLEAYVAAGYQANDGHAARLAGNGRIKARVAELQVKAAEKAEVTIEAIAAQLDEDRQLAHEKGQASAAVAASMGKAKLYGYLIDRSDVQVRQISEFSDEELDRRLTQILEGSARPVTH